MLLCHFCGINYWLCHALSVFISSAVPSLLRGVFAILLDLQEDRLRDAPWSQAHSCGLEAVHRETRCCEWPKVFENSLCGCIFTSTILHAPASVESVANKQTNFPQEDIGISLIEPISEAGRLCRPTNKQPDVRPAISVFLLFETEACLKESKTSSLQAQLHGSVHTDSAKRQGCRPLHSVLFASKMADINHVTCHNVCVCVPCFLKMQDQDSKILKTLVC